MPLKRICSAENTKLSMNNTQIKKKIEKRKKKILDSFRNWEITINPQHV